MTPDDICTCPDCQEVESPCNGFNECVNNEMSQCEGCMGYQDRYMDDVHEITAAQMGG